LSHAPASNLLVLFADEVPRGKSLVSHIYSQGLGESLAV